MQIENFKTLNHITIVKICKFSEAKPINNPKHSFCDSRVGVLLPCKSQRLQEVK